MCCCLLPRPPHPGARTLTRTHFPDSAFPPENSLGCSPAHLAGGLSLPSCPGARTHSDARGHLGATLRARHLAFAPSSWLSREAHTAAVGYSGLERSAYSDTKSVFVMISAPPPSPSLHTWTYHTRCPPLAPAVLCRHPSHQRCVGMRPRAPVTPRAEPGNPSGRWADVALGPPTPRLGFLRPRETMSNSERAPLPSPRPRSRFRLVLISLHSYAPRSTVSDPALAGCALRDSSALTQSPAAPAAPGLFPEFGYPPNSAPPPALSAPVGQRVTTLSPPPAWNRQRGNRRNGERVQAGISPAL